MKDRRKNVFTCPVTLALAVLLISCYMVAYFVLVIPSNPAMKAIDRSYPRRAIYRYFHSHEANVFFGPINWIDRQIRRGTWTIFM